MDEFKVLNKKDNVERKKTYEKSLALNPQNDNARGMLNTLREKK